MLCLKLARIALGNVSKKGKNLKGIITWNVFARWFEPNSVFISRIPIRNKSMMSIIEQNTNYIESPSRNFDFKHSNTNFILFWSFLLIYKFEPLSFFDQIIPFSQQFT